MALTERNWIERVVIVLNEAGSFRGAHQERYHLVERDGQQVAHDVVLQPVEPAALAALLPDHAAAVAQVSSATHECAAAVAEAEQLRDQVAALSGELDAARAEIERLASPPSAGV